MTDTSTQNPQPSTLITRTEPWLVESAIELLEKYVTLNSKIFEFGSGASTIYFWGCVDTLVSVEHSEAWYDAVILKLDTFEFSNHKYIHIPQPYNHIIEEYEDNYFNLILVDGRNRNACIRSAIPKLKKGGWLVLDNSERYHYAPGKSLMHTWNQIHCTQRQPDKYGFVYPDWTTSIYIKP